MPCGCGGGKARRQAQAPKLPVNNQVVDDSTKLHPNAIKLNNIKKLAEENRKLSKLKREQLLKALLKP